MILVFLWGFVNRIIGEEFVSWEICIFYLRICCVGYGVIFWCRYMFFISFNLSLFFFSNFFLDGRKFVFYRAFICVKYWVSFDFYNGFVWVYGLKTRKLRFREDEFCLRLFSRNLDLVLIAKLVISRYEILRF